MSYIPITATRRSRKDKRITARKKTWIFNTMIVIIVFLILLFPVLSQTVITTSGTISALFTMLLFASIMTWLTIRFVRVLALWMRGVSYGMEEVRASRLETTGGKLVEGDMVIDAPRLQKKNISRGLESIVLITAWTFFLYLLQPFITAVLWWQGYQLIAGNAFSFASVEGTFTILESSVYFGIFVFLVLLSWSEWNYWRYGRLKHLEYSL